MSGRLRILVADDDEAMRTTVSFTLVDDGYDVVEAASGSEVLRLLQPAAAASHEGTFDLLLMDIRMPGLSGLDTLRRLRRLDSPPRVILMTAFASAETRGVAEALSVPLLSKPFALEDLRRMARDTLQRPDHTSV